MTEKTLFPEIELYSSGYLSVGDDGLHEIYWEQSGNPDGEPIVLLHGGPGAATSPMHRRFFDPDHYRIILFDQRGCGKSQPLGELKDNNTQALVSDIEALRAHLEINSWHIFGGSWGSTLALTYAQAHPDRCISMTLRGIFLCEQYEVDWFMHGMRNSFPEAWDRFSDGMNKDSLLADYYALLTGDNHDAALEAGMRWYLYEGACASLTPKGDEILISDDAREHALALAKLEAHYFIHEVVATKDSLLLGIDKIRHIPCTIIQGRYDVITPIVTAHRLHKIWSEAKFVITPNSGHSSLEPEICSELIQSTEQFKSLTSSKTNQTNINNKTKDDSYEL